MCAGAHAQPRSRDVNGLFADRGRAYYIEIKIKSSQRLTDWVHLAGTASAFRSVTVRAADASRQKVTLKLRDKDNDVMKVTTFADEPFRTLLTRYCEKKGLVVAETCLNLDGDKLDLDTKPEDEDLEGGGAHPTLAPHPLASRSLAALDSVAAVLHRADRCRQRLSRVHSWYT